MISDISDIMKASVHGLFSPSSLCILSKLRGLRVPLSITELKVSHPDYHYMCLVCKILTSNMLSAATEKIISSRSADV